MNTNNAKAIQIDTDGRVVLFQNTPKKTTRRTSRQPNSSAPPAPVDQASFVNPDPSPFVVPVQTEDTVPEVSVVVQRKRTTTKAASKAPKVETAEDLAALGVMDQIRVAFSGKHLSGTVIGFLLGGIIPFTTYMVSHDSELQGCTFWTLWMHLSWYMVLGGLIFSAKTVFKWTKKAFNDGWKGMGFVVLLEGVMTTFHCQWLCIIILSYLVLINGIATGCNLAFGNALKNK